LLGLCRVLHSQVNLTPSLARVWSSRGPCRSQANQANQQKHGDKDLNQSEIQSIAGYQQRRYRRRQYQKDANDPS